VRAAALDEAAAGVAEPDEFVAVVERVYNRERAAAQRVRGPCVSMTPIEFAPPACANRPAMISTEFDPVRVPPESV
jgi:hypothetical protein